MIIRNVLFAMFACLSLNVFAQAGELAMATDTVKPMGIHDVFRAMPDSVLPYLSTTNRLDFLDFMDSGMEAKVQNQFDGHSQMTALTSDSLSIRLSEQSRVDMVLLSVLGEPIDSCSQVICLMRTYGQSSQPQDIVIEYYSLHWRRLDSVPPLTPISQNRLRRKKSLTVVNWYRDTLNKP